MPVITVDTAGDPRLSEYRSVAAPELTRTSGTFVAEGRLVVQRLIEDGRYRVRSVLLNPAARRELQRPLARLDPGVPIYVCPGDWFREITGFNIHRGCLALADRPAALSPPAVLAAIDLAVVLEAVGNADNVGGVFRNAAAFGVGGVLLGPGCCDPLYRKAIRTSMAATLRVPFARVDDWPGGLDLLKTSGFTLVALTPREPAVSLDDFVGRQRPERVAVMVGAEGDGLTSGALDRAEHRVRIPISSTVDSLNVSVAAAIALARLSRLTDSATSHKERSN